MSALNKLTDYGCGARKRPEQGRSAASRDGWVSELSMHISDHPPIVPVDPGRSHTGAIYDCFETSRLLSVDDKRHVEIDNCAVLGGGREPSTFAHVRQEIAESEGNPDSIDSLDRLQHVRMVAKNEINSAARSHCFRKSSLLSTGLTVILDAPVKTQNNKLGASLLRCATIGDDSIRVD
jgi:hypothetical protein